MRIQRTLREKSCKGTTNFSHTQIFLKENAFFYKNVRFLAIKKNRLRDSSCDPCRIQTCNPHIRSVVLYSVELMDRTFSKKRAKVLLFFDMCKYFRKKMQFLCKKPHFPGLLVALFGCDDVHLPRSAETHRAVGGRDFHIRFPT